MRLENDEYVEQAHFFHVVLERLKERTPLQELLAYVREELLATSKLVMAVEFLLTELKHVGMMGEAMQRLGHYFAPFQTYVVLEAEREQGRFSMEMAFQVLHREAEYRATDPDPQGLFFYQFETLCRNRLRYDQGLEAMAGDPVFDESWRSWILTVRRQIGLVDMADLVFVRSPHSRVVARQRGQEWDEQTVLLFGEKEGRIAWANRRKDPLYLFAALQRHLGYPRVPRPPKPNQTAELIPQLLRRVERMEVRIKLLEEEQRSGAVDLSRFYQGSGKKPKVD
jgi:hypothetical protein